MRIHVWSCCFEGFTMKSPHLVGIHSHVVVQHICSKNVEKLQEPESRQET